MKNKLISIITINLNNASGLRRTLHSLENQTWQNFDSIIIDGASRDDSVGVIKEYVAKGQLHIAKWLSEKDSGVYSTQNKGIRAAKGKYLLFLNSGDYLCADNTLAVLNAETWKTDFVYGNILVRGQSADYKTNLPETITPEYLYRDTLMHPATFIKRRLFNRVGYYREDFKICSDYYFFVKAILHEKATLQYCPDIVSVFELGGISSNPKYADIHRKEREQTIAELFPPKILNEILMNTVLKIHQRMNSFKFAVFALPRYFYRKLRGA